MLLDFSLKNEHNYQITDVFKKIDKLSILLNYTSMVGITIQMWGDHGKAFKIFDKIIPTTLRELTVARVKIITSQNLFW